MKKKNCNRTQTLPNMVKPIFFWPSVSKPNICRLPFCRLVDNMKICQPKCLLLSFHWGSFRFDCSDRSQNIEKLSMGCPSNHFCCQTIQISPAIKTPPQCFEYTSSKCFKCNCLLDSLASNYTGGQPLGKYCFEPGFSYDQVHILIWIRFLSMKAKVACQWSY